MGRDKSNTNNKPTKKEKMAQKKKDKAEQFEITHGKNKVQRNTNNKASNGQATRGTGGGEENKLNKA